MKVTVLIENSAPEGLTAEWGLSLFIECQDGRYLLDAGGSEAFADNARKLGVALEAADAAILSHGHYDHSGGLDAFCKINDHAMIFIRESVGENCYSWHKTFPKYIGVQRGMMKRNRDRFARVQGDHYIAKHVILVPHKDDKLSEKGKRAEMYVRRGLILRPDGFRHEQSLVFDLPGGLVIFSSCSHSGVDSILDEVGRTFPGKPIRAMVGGFHLVRTPPREIHLLAQRLEGMGVPELYTGHCTGDAAMEILEKALPGHVHRMETGMTFEIAEG